MSEKKKKKERKCTEKKSETFFTSSQAKSKNINIKSTKSQMNT